MAEPGGPAVGRLRRVRLGGCPEGADPALHGPQAGALRSEALLRLDLDGGGPGAMLALGAVEAERFRPGQGTDLLAFLAAALEIVLRRTLAEAVGPAAAALPAAAPQR
jgi:uncharacterized protein YigA (DUF484 family)